MTFTWDSEKEQANVRKHGIDFKTAAEVFDDPNQIVQDNYFYEHDGEQRWQAIGITNNIVLLLVVFVDRSSAEEEVVRIISARQANDYEERLYTAYSEGQDYR